MKRIVSLAITMSLLVTMVSTGLFSISANAATSGNYTYTIANGEATITKVNTSIAGAVSIPSYLGGYSVTTIGTNAFAGCKDITSISIGNSIETICENAFLGCTSITSISIGSEVKTINPAAFLGCINILSITVNANNYAYYSLNNCLIENETLTLVLGCKNSVIPSDGKVTSIGPNAFYYCSDINSVIIPNAVKSIGNSAFFGADIVEIDLGNNVTSIGAYAFASCVYLQDVIIPDSIEFIGTGAFAGCDELLHYEYNGSYYLGNEDNNYLVLKAGYTDNTTYTIPEGVKCIYDEAMSQCTSLETFEIPSTVTSIGSFAFANCSSLKNLVIPNSVSYVGTSAFLDCDNLVYNTYNNGKYLGNSSNKYIVFIEPTTKNISNINFATGVKCIYSRAFEDCINLTSITIPSDVSMISEGAFDGCTSLKSISLGEQVKYISGYAFNACSSLQTVTFGKSIVEIGGYAFYDCPNLKTVGYRASQTVKNKIFILLGNEALLNATWNYAEGGEFSGTTTNPVKPIVIDYTSDMVMLYPFEGYEFSMDGVNWQIGNTFTDLEDDTTYTFYQRIRTPSNNATASTIVVTTASFGWDTVKEFDYLQYVINRDYNYVVDDCPSVRIYEDFDDSTSGYFAMTDYGSYIEFTIFTTTGTSSESSYLGSLTSFQLSRNSTTLYIEHLYAFYYNNSLYDSAYGNATLDRYEHERGDTYSFYRSGNYVIDEYDFCESFNNCFTVLTYYIDEYLYYNYDSGLELLGFISFDGVGPGACDPVLDYHIGYAEVRGYYEPGCALDGETGSVYCSACDRKILVSSPIQSNGHHNYDNDCDEVCNDCNEHRVVVHTYSSDCDAVCDICSARRIPSDNHVFDDENDMYCNICGGGKYTPGDIDGLAGISDADARYLLMYTFFPEDYPVDQSCDFNGDNSVDDNDARYLLMHTFFPEDYPLNS